MPTESQIIKLDAISESLNSGAMLKAKLILNGLHPAEIARLLESSPSRQRRLIWEMLDHKNDGEVLLEVGEEVRNNLMESMDDESLLAATKGLDVDDLADLLDELPETVVKQALKGMDYQYRTRLEGVMNYDEDTAGGLMNTDTITIRPDVTLDVVLKYLRLRKEMPQNTDNIIVVDRYNHYLGTLSVTALLCADPEKTVSESMDNDYISINADTLANEVTNIFEDRDLVSAPVVDKNNILLGRITIDDVVDVIREESEHTVLNMAGLTDEEDIFAPVLPSTRRRAIWLGINLLTALIASGVISLFQETIEQVVALAVLMPIVASMGGIAGSQTLTLVIRGIALGNISSTNSKSLLVKEISIGLLNSLLWACVIGVLSSYWFNNYLIGVVIGIAMIANLGFAALSGVLIPIMLKRIGVDPALGGGVILTTITDVIGFSSFLALGTIFLL
ncbi:MAG: magnesium transporter [Pseudomonadota bacterium]|jgi:magnesium transporter|nr:magnesium transporter [Pseudomonadota bacterium]|tara:strand:- start:13321 stop:14667 length:1347 start_codon:yes stop_codon:yes gene_type:complete